MSEAVTTQIDRRIRTIQERRNFDPKAGVDQIQSDAFEDYYRFRELVDLIIKCKLPIEIPYDPAATGLDARIKIIPQPHVYFQQAMGFDLYKVGFSTKPWNRLKAVQTGNHLSLGLKTIIPVATLAEARDIERRILFHFRKHKTRNRNSRKGEWLDLTPALFKLALELANGAKNHDAKTS
jgi:hypothetical protein